MVTEKSPAKTLALTTLAATILAACATTPQPKLPQETRECMEYRAMMTAPMPPSEHQKLREACERSTNP